MAGPVEPSLLYYRGMLYALKDNGVLICLDGQTGRENYQERLGGECNSSPVASDGRIFASNIQGRTFVIQAGAKMVLLATNDLGPLAWVLDELRKSLESAGIIPAGAGGCAHGRRAGDRPDAGAGSGRPRR